MSFGETFLRYPDLFPARRAGEPWGDRTLVLDLPGGPYRFSGLSAEQEARALGRFGLFLLADAPGPPVETVETSLFRAAPSDFLPIDVRGWNYDLDLDPGPSSVRVAGLDLMGRLDWRPERPGITGALWTCEPGDDRFPGIFENFCRMLVAYRLHEMGGAVIHGAAVVDGGAAMLFAGPSGAGKTTVSRMALASGRAVLSDDLNALMPPASGGAALAGLPFTGDLEGGAGAGEVYPLRGIFRLEKDTDDALRPLSRAETAALLLACSPFLNADPHRRGAVLTNLLALTDGVPAFSLHFSLSGRMWSILPVE